MRYGNTQAGQPRPSIPPPGFPYQQRAPQQSYMPRPQPSTPAQAQGSSIEDLIKALASNTIQFQQQTQASFKNLENTMGKIDTSLSKMEIQNSGKLPSQAERNPKENVSAVTLRSGKQYDPPATPPPQPSPGTPLPTNDLPPTAPVSKPVIPHYVTQPPFPSRLRPKPKEEN